MTVIECIGGYLILAPILGIIMGKLIARGNAMDVIDECNPPPMPALSDPEAMSAWFQAMVLRAVLNQVEPAGQG